MIADLDKHLPDIRAICAANGVRRLDLFGSGARGDFDPARSDLDFLVEFEEAPWKGSSNRYFNLLFGLEDLMGRRIDLVEPSAVTNPHFMPIANQHRIPLYDRQSAQAA